MKKLNQKQNTEKLVKIFKIAVKAAERNKQGLIEDGNDLVCFIAGFCGSLVDVNQHGIDFLKDTHFKV